MDGSEASVRNKPTELAKIIADGMLAAAPGSEIAIYNGGSIRIDDTIQPGELTEYDVIRILPFGGKIVSIKVKGEFLKRILAQGIANKGQGGYLQTAGITYNLDQPLHKGAPIEGGRDYIIAISDFLDRQRGELGWLKKDGNARYHRPSGARGHPKHHDCRTEAQVWKLASTRMIVPNSWDFPK